MEGKGGTDMRFSRQLALLISTLVLGAGVSVRAQTVCLDPGHGGHDPGAVGCGLEEAAVNLDTALRLRDQLAGAGYTVLMTRDTDVFVELVGRAEYANSNECRAILLRRYFGEEDGEPCNLCDICRGRPERPSSFSERACSGER